jgi:hypothetical protein
MDGTRNPGLRILVALLLAVVLPPPGNAAAQGAPDSAHVGRLWTARLGAYSTTLIGSLPARTANIRLSAQALDGAVIAPGEVLSFDERVGPRTAERGYLDAPVILREAKDVQVGGGICQVASTMFAAALLSGLSVPRRYRHSFPVDYIAPAHDATIAWGAKDLRVRNDLDQPVRLRLQVLGSTLSAWFEGEEALAESFELEIVEHDAPGGSGGDERPGREIELYRVRKRDGEEVEREFVHRDRYPATRPLPRETRP